MIHNIAFQPIPYPGGRFEAKNRSRGPAWKAYSFWGISRNLTKQIQEIPVISVLDGFGSSDIKCDSPSQNVQDMRGSGQGWIGSFSSEDCR